MISTREQVVDFGERAMVQHGLGEWSFKFDNSLSRAGCCNYTTKTISISKNLVGKWDMASVEDTILHEVAHAIVGHKHGHDKVWVEKALEIGSTAQIYHDMEFSTPKYYFECKCGKTRQCRYRLGVRLLQKKICGQCHSKPHIIYRTKDSHPKKRNP